MPLVAFAANLTRSAKTFLAGSAINSIGTGLVYPFVAVYLTKTVGIAAGVVGAFLAVSAATAIGSGLLAGRFSDRDGPWVPIILGTVVQGLGTAAIAFTRSPAVGFAAFALLGVGNGLYYAALAPVIARIAPDEESGTVYAWQNFITNGGVGIGALVGGLVLIGGPDHLPAVLVADGATYLVFGLVLKALRTQLADVVSQDAPSPDQAGDEETSEPSTMPARPIGAVRDATLRRLMFIQLALVTFVFTQTDAAMLLAFRVHAFVSAAELSILIAVNTVSVLIAQPIIASLSKRWGTVHSLRRIAFPLLASAALCAGAVFFAHRSNIGLTVAIAGLGYLLLAVAECLYSVAMWPLVIEIAPADRLGQYSSLVQGSWSVGQLLGPILGLSLATSRAHYVIWLLMAAAGCSCLLPLAHRSARPLNLQENPA